MKLLELTLPTPAENLALDEALLDAAEAGELTGEVLRLWEFQQAVVVLGRSSRVEQEVNVAACREAKVPIVRRASGGAAVVAGPGCLMYSVVLRYKGRQHLRLIDQAHQHVLGIVARALQSLNVAAEQGGISDLVTGNRKFSGNSLRCKRDHLLYHGTLLYNFDLSLIDRLLRMPPRQPEYRGGRPHGEFVMNLDANASSLKAALAEACRAREVSRDWPNERVAELMAKRYGLATWIAAPDAAKLAGTRDG